MIRLHLAELLLSAMLVMAESGCEPNDKRGAPAEPAPTPAEAPEILPPSSTCPARLVDFPAADRRAERSCDCPVSALTGQVWGSGIYTADSAVCAAAVHAGAITRAGGRVTLRVAAGCATYLGTTNNGITTSPTDRRERSFFFPSVSDGKCGPEPDGS